MIVPNTPEQFSTFTGPLAIPEALMMPLDGQCLEIPQETPSMHGHPFNVSNGRTIGSSCTPFVARHRQIQTVARIWISNLESKNKNKTHL
jgi:hypothetical protein